MPISRAVGQISEDSKADPAAGRVEAVAAFDRAWELIEPADRTCDEGVEMLDAAFASR